MGFWDWLGGRRRTRGAGQTGAASPKPPPPDDVLYAGLREVGYALGWSLAHEDRREGLFIWRIKLAVPDSDPTHSLCEGTFSWHMKRVGNELLVDDPVHVRLEPVASKELFLEYSGRVEAAVRRLQEEFKRRWLAQVGPVALQGPGPGTHSMELLMCAVNEIMGWTGRRSPASGPRD
jgi:hypothetical protein